MSDENVQSFFFKGGNKRKGSHISFLNLESTAEVIQTKQ